MNGIDRLATSDALIYVAGRLFDIDEKIKSEMLEEAVLAGVASAGGAEIDRRPTFVPFRDAGQEDLVADDKTRRLFELDLARLDRTVLLVSYIDGLAKDEGVCFEVGYAYGVGVPIVLVSTDFFSVELPTGETVPFEPLLVHAATTLIRRPQLTGDGSGTFFDTLLATRTEVLAEVSATVRDLLLRPQRPREPAEKRVPRGSINVLVDFGGGVFAWQHLLYELLTSKIVDAGRVHISRTHRYDVESSEAAHSDVRALMNADILVTCVDADEAPSGTAFLQGVACALGRPVWMYSSKRTFIRAAGGYRSSRNLMLDYSASMTFRTLDQLAEALRSL